MARAREAHTLERLFGSIARVRLLRFFIMNPNEAFGTDDISVRTRAKGPELKRELDLLVGIGLLKKTSVVAKDGKSKKKKVPGWQLVRDFPYLNELAQLLESSAPQARDMLLHRIRSVGRIAFLVITGKLLGYSTEQVDVFIVGDVLKKSKVEKLLQDIETEIGRELVYATMATQEFQYRHGMNDRFVAMLLASPHEILINKIGIVTPMRDERTILFSSDTE